MMQGEIVIVSTPSDRWVLVVERTTEVILNASNLICEVPSHRKRHKRMLAC